MSNTTTFKIGDNAQKTLVKEKTALESKLGINLTDETFSEIVAEAINNKTIAASAKKYFFEKLK